MKAKFLGLAVALAGCMAVLPAHALTADGLTYTLTAFATPNPVVADLTLTISGINGTADDADEGGGRYGVFAIAFNNPPGATFVSLPGGFALMPGGLSSGSSGGGCEGSGNFVCFQNTQPINQWALGANSTLSFNFAVDMSGMSAASDGDYQDDFRISWDGSNSNNYGTSDFQSGYDHLSQNLTISATPAPEIDTSNAAAALTFLLGGLAMVRARRRKA